MIMNQLSAERGLLLELLGVRFEEEATEFNLRPNTTPGHCRQHTGSREPGSGQLGKQVDWQAVQADLRTWPGAKPIGGSRDICGAPCS